MESLDGRRGPSIAAALILLTVGVPGAVFAFWASSGSGSGHAASGTTQPVTVTPATPTTRLFPGGASGVALSVSNPNAGSVRVESLALDTSQGIGGFAVDSEHAGCAVSSLTFATQTNGGSGWTVAGNESSTFTLASALAMSASAADACQGATFSVFVKVDP